MDRDSGYSRTRLPQLKSDKIETFIRELQNIELGTSEGIYRVLIPPLSHYNKLPNESLADWCNERLIRREVSLLWSSAFHGCIELINTVQHREVQDRFANRVAAIIDEFLLRVTEDPKLFTKDSEEKALREIQREIQREPYGIH